MKSTRALNVSSAYFYAASILEETIKSYSINSTGMGAEPRYQTAVFTAGLARSKEKHASQNCFMEIESFCSITLSPLQGRFIAY